VLHTTLRTSHELGSAALTPSLSMFFLYALLGGVQFHPVTSGTGWAQLEHAPHPHEEVSFTIALKQNNGEILKARAIEVNTPHSGSYGKFLSSQEVNALTAPTPTAVATVTTWLRSHGVPFVARRELLRVRTTVHRAESLLSSTFVRYVAEDGTGRTLVRAATYALPHDVADVVAAVFGLHGLPLPSQPKLAPPSKIVKVTPAVIASTYAIDKPFVNRKSKNRQAVAEFQGQRMDKADLEKFFKEEVPNAQPGDEQIAKYAGAEGYTEGKGVEALLDIEFIMGVSPGVKTEFWSFPNTDFCGDLLNYTDQLLSTDDVPITHSISYGWQGDLARLNCKDAEIDAIDLNWAKLAAKGFSIMISSGDSGSGYSKPSCMAGGAHKAGVEITEGTVIASLDKDEMMCCERASDTPTLKGWTWKPPRSTTRSFICPSRQSRPSSRLARCTP